MWMYSHPFISFVWLLVLSIVKRLLQLWRYLLVYQSYILTQIKRGCYLLFICLLLSFQTFGINSVKAQTETPPAPTQTPTFQNFWNTPTPGSSYNFTCPGVQPIGYGTKTPSSYWYLNCGQCITPISNYQFPTANPTYIQTSTPQIIGTSTPTPLPTIQGTIEGVRIRQSGESNYYDYGTEYSYTQTGNSGSQVYYQRMYNIYPPSAAAGTQIFSYTILIDWDMVVNYSGQVPGHMAVYLNLDTKTPTTLYYTPLNSNFEMVNEGYTATLGYPGQRIFTRNYVNDRFEGINDTKYLLLYVQQTLRGTVYVNTEHARLSVTHDYLNSTGMSWDEEQRITVWAGEHIPTPIQPTPDSDYCNEILSEGDPGSGGGGGGNPITGFDLPNIQIGSAVCYGTPAINIGFSWLETFGIYVNDINLPAFQVCLIPIQFGYITLFDLEVNLDVFAGIMAAALIFRIVTRS